MNKTFLFAGAGSAIAQACASLLKEKGHRVIGLTTQSALENYDGVYSLDAYKTGQFPVLEEPIDGLVYFPGTINLKPFARLPVEDFVKDYEVNALGAVMFLQNYLPLLKKSESASVVFVSSVAATTGMPFHASIAMAKAAIEGLTRSLAAELAPSIRVNCVAPSLVNTPLGEKFVNTPEKMEQMQKRNPLRKVGTAQEVAQAISFLLLPESGWVSGQVIAVDGGMNVLKNG
jgi:NAD(P)-dependent dehydrogenase (short-subunit alcohol dehydrogenase family)